AADAGSKPASEPAPKRSPLLTEVTRLEQAFEAAIAGRRAPEAAEAILNLDRTIAEWAADTLQTDDPDRARAVRPSPVQRLGGAARAAPRDDQKICATGCRTPATPPPSDSARCGSPCRDGFRCAGPSRAAPRR